jgi:hypothetical protein
MIWQISTAVFCKYRKHVLLYCLYSWYCTIYSLQNKTCEDIHSLIYCLYDTHEFILKSFIYPLLLFFSFKFCIKQHLCNYEKWSIYFYFHNSRQIYFTGRPHGFYLKKRVISYIADISFYICNPEKIIHENNWAR